MQFSKLGIFWLAFASFVVPLFTIALVCSIIKAIRTRRYIKRRMLGKELDAPRDAEIITNVRRKPKIQIIEDENRKKEFRSSRGSLFFPSRSNISPKFLRNQYEDDVDQAPYVPSKDKNKNLNNENASNRRNSTGGEVAVSGATVNSVVVYNNTHRLSVPDLSTGNNNVISCNDNVYKRSINHHNNTTHHYHYNHTNGVPPGRKYTQINDSTNSDRRRSLDSQYPFYYFQTQNGHIPERGYAGDQKDAMVMYSISRRKLDPNPGLINTHSNQSRRHSMNSATPILERIPEAVVTEVEMNNVRSKSDDHLVDPQAFDSPKGEDNKAFARSTETTIM